MHDIYEGMCAVCAVLAEARKRGPGEPSLRLAERHLHLLARLLAARLPDAPGTEGSDGHAGAAGRGGAFLWASSTQGGNHVRQ